jgi:plastocyanin
MTHLRVLALGLGICVAIGVIACGNGVPQSSSSAPPVGSAGASLGTAAVTVMATDQNTFVPAAISVKVGDVIQWTNNGTVLHTVTINNHDELSNATLQPGGGIWQIKFTVAGSYPYVCTIHAPSMAGTITVT